MSGAVEGQSVEQRVEALERQVAAFQSHVVDCADEKRKVETALARVEGQVGMVVKLIAALVAVVGPSLVAIAIALT